MELAPLESPSSSERPKSFQAPKRPASDRYLSVLAAAATYVLIGVLLAIPLVFIGLPRLSMVKFGACMDGNFRMSDINSPFDVRTAFAVSLGFGSFEFAVAKGIDAVFDLVVGRGGKVLLAWLTYPIFTKVLLGHMETRSASSRKTSLDNDIYRWGFSYLLLLVIVVFTYAWAGVLVALHAYAERNSRLARAGRGLGLYRAVLDLAKAIREELGEEAQGLSNEALERRLKEAREGLRYWADMPRQTQTVPNKAAGCTGLSPLVESDREE